MTAISALSAAKALCEAADWRLTNLSLQKILYLAHMIYMGKHNGEPLIREAFEAWDYGPVVPSLYHRVKIFGNTPIKNIFHSIPPVSDAELKKFLVSASQQLSKYDPARLVSITHSPDGAWAKHYAEGSRFITIPNSDILDEYRTRQRRAQVRC